MLIERIAIDVDTSVRNNWLDLVEVKPVPGNYKDEAKINAKMAENREAAHAGAGSSLLASKVTAVHVVSIDAESDRYKEYTVGEFLQLLGGDNPSTYYHIFAFDALNVVRHIIITALSEGNDAYPLSVRLFARGTLSSLCDPYRLLVGSALEYPLQKLCFVLDVLDRGNFDIDKADNRVEACAALVLRLWPGNQDLALPIGG